MQNKTPIESIAKDLNADPERIKKWAQEEGLPVPMSGRIRDAIAAAKAATIRAAAGAVCALVLTLSAYAAPDDRLLDAIQQVETGGHPDPAHAVGDDGKARGWYQMWPSFYADAKQWNRLLKPYRECAADREDSRRAVMAYWARYKCKDDRTKALVFHYGPSARKKDYMDRHGYWEKVKKAMK